MTKFDEQPAPRAQENPYLPAGAIPPLICEDFMGINTSTSRPGVDPKQLYWCDGFMPLGPRFLRTIPGVGDALYTAVTTSISFFDFFNIGATPYSVVIGIDGSITVVNTTTLVSTEIAPAGTILNPSRTGVGITQWGSQYLIIVADQTNGYFLWDGTVFYQAGGIGPQVTITNGGSNYSNPTITVSGGSGSGATFSATVLFGIITSITVTNPGHGYLATDTLTVHITDSTGTGAAATVILMPFAVQGTGVETYSGRVWVINGPVLSWTAPGSVFDFSTANGGGNITSSDSFLRVGYTQLKQTNGFLYLIGDSSINYISGVQTSGVTPTTTFTNQNADPEVGTPYPATVDVFGRNFVFANAFGVHVSYGAAVTKISEPLDGVFNTVANFAGFQLSACKHILYGKKIWAVLVPIIDPVSGQQRIKMFMTNDLKKWWATEQDVALIYIQHQEINSILTAYGTDGTSIYPLFQNPSNGFEKTFQSKFWTEPGGYQFDKSVNRVWMLAQYFSTTVTEIDVRIDNELTNASFAAIPISPPQVTWLNNASVVVTWLNNAAQIVTWVTTGLSVSDGMAVGQNGYVVGFTVETAAEDVAVISAMIGPQIVGYKG